jgi:hypothetical protein
VINTRGALEVVPCFANISVMQRHLRNHHHGIWVIAPNGTEVRLLTIGYLAAALRRSRWTILHWERLGLLPPAPFVINPERHRAKRRLYPEDYVRELSRITYRHYPGPELKREIWVRFQDHVYDAYDRLVVPLLVGVIPPVEIELRSTDT